MLPYLNAYKEVLTDINLYSEHNKCRGKQIRFTISNTVHVDRAVTAGGMSTIPSRADIWIKKIKTWVNRRRAKSLGMYLLVVDWLLGVMDAGRGREDWRTILNADKSSEQSAAELWSPV